MFANPWDPLVCPFFTMSVYFSTTYTDMIYEEGLLFPGQEDERHKAFNDAFNKLVFLKRDEIFTRFGMNYKDIGIQSARGLSAIFRTFLAVHNKHQSASVLAGPWAL